MTIGACATAGGIQALRNVADHDSWRAAVYPEPAWIDSLATATPIADHVTVDAELRGCPIAPGQLVEFLTATLVGRRPQLPDEAVCLECKRAGRVCVVVASGEPCLGPVTRTGCGALCPAFARGCYACFGPRESANVAGLRRGLVSGRPDRGRGGRALRRLHGHGPDLCRHGICRGRRLPRRHGRRADDRSRGGGLMHGGEGHGTGSGTATAPTVERDFDIGQLTRVEGEGSLRLRLREGKVVDARLAIFEAPRYFEQLVVGRQPDDVLDIVARICGICPVAYQMSGAHAFEALFGVEIDPVVRSLRRLLYCGEWIESHALHVTLLHAPDFLGVESGIALAAIDRGAVERGLALKKTGNHIVSLLGGRPIHPVSVRVGGFSRAPRVSELAVLKPALDLAVEQSLAMVDWVAAFTTPAYVSSRLAWSPSSTPSTTP